MTPEDPWLLPFLRRLNVRPGAHLGAEDVRTLEVYLSAYTFARTDLGLPAFGRGEETLLDDFEHWLGRDIKQTTTLGWSSLIEKLDPSSKNVHIFLRQFDRFLREERGIVDGLSKPSTE